MAASSPCGPSCSRRLKRSAFRVPATTTVFTTRSMTDKHFVYFASTVEQMLSFFEGVERGRAGKEILK